MASAPKVSVVLPTHNRARLVGRAIDSVLAQTMDDLELIVVDDASTDDTQDALKVYAGDPRVKIVLAERNLGGGGARNRGIEEARADLIAFQDSDDRWLPEKLARQIEALDADGAAELCYCGSIFYGDRKSYYIPEPFFDRLDGDMSKEVLRRNPTSTQTLLIRRGLLERSGAFDPDAKRFQDWDIVIRMAQETRFAFVEEPLALIYETPGNISSSLINGARGREMILRKYAHLYDDDPAEYAAQNYITGRYWQKAGRHAEALASFGRAQRARRSAKTAAAAALSYAKRLTGARPAD